jgi:hypothetical protein
MEEQNQAKNEDPPAPTSVEGSSASQAEDGVPLPGGFTDIPDPFGGNDAIGEQSLPPDEGAGVVLDESSTEREQPAEEAAPIELLVTTERPRFQRGDELKLALGEYLELFPAGRSSMPGAERVSLRALSILFLVSVPAFLVLGAVSAAFAAGLGKFVGDPLKVSLWSGTLALLVDTGTCILVVVGSSAAATWAARITRCWNNTLVAACAALGALLLAAAIFLPLFHEVAFAPMDGWIGPFTIGWWVVALALLVGPAAAALLASATVGAGRICADTGTLLTAAIRVRFGLPEGLAAREVIEEENFEDLAAIDGLPESVENFIEMTLYMGEGAKLAVLELEARFWAEVGPVDAITESSAKVRRARRWLVHSEPLEDATAKKLMSLNWQALAHLSE